MFGRVANKRIESRSVEELTQLTRGRDIQEALAE